MSELENVAVDTADDAGTPAPKRQIRRVQSGAKSKGSMFSDNAPKPEPVAARKKREVKAPGNLTDGRVRRPLGKRNAKLAAPPREGYYRRYINDVPGRIESALAGGYTFVQDSAGRNWERTVDRNDKGGGLTGFLMEIPLELWSADQEAKQAEIDETDEQIYGGTYGPGAASDGRYVPKFAPISINIQKGPGSDKVRR